VTPGTSPVWEANKNLSGQSSPLFENVHAIPRSTWCALGSTPTGSGKREGGPGEGGARPTGTTVAVVGGRGGGRGGGRQRGLAPLVVVRGREGRMGGHTPPPPGSDKREGGTAPMA
jgi:hypothetical protein